MIAAPHRRTLHAIVVAATAAALALVLAAASAHAAPGRCVSPAGGRLAPRVTSPCDGATVAAGRAIVFTILDRDAQASAHAPYLDVSTSRDLVDGHLAPNRDGDGIFAQGTAVPGRAHAFTYTAPREAYASWWDDHAGTVYVQVEQVDPRAAAGIVYGPITTLRVR